MRNLRIGLMVFFAVLWAGAVGADKGDWHDRDDFAPVPQTGQMLCYDSDGPPPINCAGTGQDGALQKGVELPTPRFKDNQDGTITDKLTGLIWLKNANCIGTSHPTFDADDIPGDGQVTWQHALDFVAGINNGKYNCGDTSGKEGRPKTDWRLPNIRELHSLVDFAFYNPAHSNAAGTEQGSSSDPFSNFVDVNTPSAYWSSTTYLGTPNFAFAWVVSFSSGGLGPPRDKSFSFNVVTAVRGGSEDR